MTKVTQTYTGPLNVSITVEDDGSLRGVTTWTTGSDHTRTERHGTADYTRPRFVAPKPLDLNTPEGRVEWLRRHPEAYTDGGRRSASRILAIKRLREAAYNAGVSVEGRGLLAAKVASEDPSLYPNHPVHGPLGGYTFNVR